MSGRRISEDESPAKSQSEMNPLKRAGNKKKESIQQNKGGSSRGCFESGNAPVSNLDSSRSICESPAIDCN